jgi:3-methylcrotonyl-CoA carboxylase alpha subunit
VALRDWNVSAESDHPTPWTLLTSRRFGGDEYKRTITIQPEGQEEGCTVNIISTLMGQYEVLVTIPGEKVVRFSSVTAHLFNKKLSATLNQKYTHTTIVSQSPGPHSPNAMERLHVFSGGRKTILTLPVPKWLLSLAGDSISSQGLLKAPMPSLIVELRVKVGDRVEQGQGVVVLESMKTETVLRADTAGVVRSVGCIAGEQVEEGRELVEIEFERE